MIKNDFFDIPLPTLEEALEMTKEFKHPIGHCVLLLNAVAPMVTQSGVAIPETATANHQQHINDNGMLVLWSPFKQPKDGEERDINAVYPGEVVMYGKNTQARLITTVTDGRLVRGLDLAKGTIPIPEMYQRYVIMVVQSHDVVMLMNK